MKMMVCLSYGELLEDTFYLLSFAARTGHAPCCPNCKSRDSRTLLYKTCPVIEAEMKLIRQPGVSIQRLCTCSFAIFDNAAKFAQESFRLGACCGHIPGLCNSRACETSGDATSDRHV
jgi:hypothetical protein